METYKTQVQTPNSFFIIFLKIVKIYISFGVAFVLSNRELGIVPDDENYLFHFARHWDVFDYSLVPFFIEEPLWTAYTVAMGSVFSPDVSLRLTIFFGTLLFLLTLLKFSSKAFLFSVLFFIAAPEFAIQMYMNQIRQGFALTIFMLLFSFGKNLRILGVLLAGLVHSSFLLLIPSMVIARGFKSSALISSFYAIAIPVTVYILSIYASNFDLGRRGDTYQLHGTVNINYYFFSICAFILYSL